MPPGNPYGYNFWTGTSYTPQLDPAQFGQITGSNQIRRNLFDFLQNQQGAQAPTVNTGREDEFRGRSLSLIRNLEDIASGRTEGAGEMAARRAGEEARAAAASNVAGVRGFGAQAARAEMNQANNLMAGDIAGRRAEAAASDAGAARSMLGQMLTEGRRADQATALANLEAEMRQRGMSNDAILAALSQLQGLGLGELGLSLSAYQAADQTGLSQQRPGAASYIFPTLAQVGAAYAGAA